MARRVLVFIFAAFFANGDALDDAVGQWARKISAHLASDEVARVTWNEAGMTAKTDPGGPTGYAARAKTLLAKSLQRRLRSPKTVEVTATFSENLKGYVLIAEIHHDTETSVEMASVPRPSAVASSPGFRLERRFLWEQERPILDLLVIGGQMLVLDTIGLTRYEQRDSQWRKAEAAALEFPSVRDPRGRITVMENSVATEVAGLTCHGTWQPALAVECQPGGRFTALRNTIEENGWPAYFTHAEMGGDHIVAAADGRTYIYDSTRKQLGVAGDWGDFVVVSSPCAGAKIVAAASTSNTLAIFDLVNHNPGRVGDSMELAGLVTAMWPMGDTALAVIRNKSTDRYEAYSIGVACGR